MNVLLAYEDPDQHYSFQRAIQDYNKEITIISVYNGMQLLDHLLHESIEGRSSPDLIITDVHIPFVNGLEIVKRLRKTRHFGKIPVHLFSSENSEEMKSEAIQTGAQGFYRTPAAFSDLKSIISQIIQRHLN